MIYFFFVDGKWLQSRDGLLVRTLHLAASGWYTVWVEQSRCPNWRKHNKKKKKKSLIDK